MNTSKVIFIRADANSHIASGHIMRCLTIAGSLRQNGCQVSFLVSDAASEEALRIRGESSAVCLHGNYKNLEEELPTLLPLLKEQKPDCFLLDSYYASSLYMESVRALCRLVYLDDLQAFDYPADLIINYDLTADAAMYKGTPSLTGSAYAPLRKQFENVSYEVREEVSSILISTGGSDNYGAAAWIFQTLFESECFASPSITWHILTGSLNPHKKELYALSARHPQIMLHENITEMAALLSSCDLAFSAGGTTLFELCAVGVPTVSFAISDEQHPCVQSFAKAGAIPFAGDVWEGKHFLQNLLSEGQHMAQNPNRRRHLSAFMRQLIDGKGADRIARAITAGF